MTTFTTEDREKAWPWVSAEESKKLVEKAPYHPGYEDAIITQDQNSLLHEINEYRENKLKTIETAKRIVDFIRNKQKA